MSITSFKSLHHGTNPLIIGNVWDAHSAQLAEKSGFEALGTSSHAIANLLGYADGEQIPFDELFFMVQHIAKAVKIPVSVDLEAGYSDDPATVAKHVKRLADIGIVGINLEDGKVSQGKRHLGSAELLCEKIKAIKQISDLYVNARTDTYVTKHEDPLGEAIKRSNLYKKAGADGIFVPLIENASDIRVFVSEIYLPLNVFLTPKLPAFAELEQLGVKRISHGAKLYEWLYKEAEGALEELKKTVKLPQ